MNPPLTLHLLRHVIAQQLEEAGIENSFDEAKWLICGALDVDASFFVTQHDLRLSQDQMDVIQSFLERRLQGEPLARIRGVREFWSLPFSLNKATLDPRPDSEVVVETALKYIPEHRPLTLLDLGTGSGCLLISLLHERPLSWGIGADLSWDAAHQAAENAALNQVNDRCSFVVSSWGQAFQDHQFDLIISNPPYIPLSDKPKLSPEVTQYDPDLALYGGEDGLVCYRILVSEIGRLLKPGGVCVLEIGHDQAEQIQDIFKDKAFTFVEKISDLGGRDRGLVFKA